MPKRKSKNSCKTEKRKKFKEELANEEDGETEDKKSSETHTSDQEEESQSIKTVETRSEEKLEKAKNVVHDEASTKEEEISKLKTESECTENKELKINDEEKVGDTKEKNLKKGNEENLETRNILDATDSQLCNIDEEISPKIYKEYKKQNFGISTGSDKVIEILGQLSSMNRIIMEAKKDLASMKLKMNHALKSSKGN